LFKIHSNAKSASGVSARQHYDACYYSFLRGQIHYRDQDKIKTLRGQALKNETQKNSPNHV
jgi:hypothetical protein